MKTTVALPDDLVRRVMSEVALRGQTLEGFGRAPRRGRDRVHYVAGSFSSDCASAPTSRTSKRTSR
jgi:hypothetical protein